MVCVISTFYKAFVQFLSGSIDSAEENLCRSFFPVAVKLVNSFILAWHSDYELSTKTQKPLFILKRA